MVECPFGGEMIKCDKSNMRFRYKDENRVREYYYTKDDYTEDDETQDENGVLTERYYIEDDEDTDEDT